MHTYQSAIGLSPFPEGIEFEISFDQGIVKKMAINASNCNDN